MNSIQRTVLLGMVFALIASLFVAAETGARNKHRSHNNHQQRSSISREAAKDRASVVNSDSKRKRKVRGSRVRVAASPQLRPAIAQPSLSDLDLTNVRINPGVLNPQPDPCDEAEAVVSGFLPQTETLTKSDSFWAKLTVGQGVQVISCDLANKYFEVRFDNATIKTYVRASAGGISVGGWNHTSSLSGSIRVSFTIGFSPPSTIVLTNLKVLGVNFANTPNWLDNSLIKDALNAIFPDSIAVS